MSIKKSVAFHTLGCKLNFSETSSISGIFEKEGFEQRKFDEVADIYVINTCSVTDNADKECRHLVRRIQRQAPASTVVVTGCYAQLKPAEIASIPGVDLVLGAAEKFNILHHVREITKGDPAKICSCDIGEVTGFHATYSGKGRTRSFLKVQDGCDYNCSFCTIPLARGKSRSDRISHVLENVQQLAADGVKEVVLTGINLGDFGKGPDGHQREENFYDLIQALDQENGIERFRISSIEPNLLSEDIIRFVAGSRKFMPHFHIPLQSGSDMILGRMRRRYKTSLYTERIKLIKKLIPHCGIGVDVIVGFPGETEEAFRETYDYLHALDVSYFHVFTYSERDDTHALTLNPVVPVQVRNERNKALRHLSYLKHNFFSSGFSGTVRPVLFESEKNNGTMEGYTDNYIRVTANYRSDWFNQLVDWKL